MDASSDERGESLIELLISLVIIGIVVFTIFEGVRVSIQASDVHRQATTASVYLRDYAEDIENYVGATQTNYQTANPTSYSPAIVGLSLPAGYTASIASGLCGDGTSWSPCSLATDVGLQQLKLQVRSPDSRATEQLVIIVRKPCGVGSSCS